MLLAIAGIAFVIWSVCLVIHEVGAFIDEMMDKD